MIYAQISYGNKMHIALEAGEVTRHGEYIHRGELSLPICGQPMTGNYRMTCNLPLASLCKKCRKLKDKP
jgi:hypothetical protein